MFHLRQLNKVYVKTWIINKTLNVPQYAKAACGKLYQQDLLVKVLSHPGHES